MSARSDCEQFRDVLPELALGTAEGRERAATLEHLAGCPDCRRELNRLATVADELLLLAPELEPSPSFEGRALAAMRGGRRRRGIARALIPALAAGLAAALTAVAMTVAFDDDRELASSYRESLEEADGEYFSAADLKAAGGTPAGHVFGYEGSPSWIFITTAFEGLGTRTYQAEAVTAEGRRVPLGPLAVENGRGSGGWTLPISFNEVTEVRLLGARPGDALRAEFRGNSR